jgi:hypothetical protein
MPTWIDEKAQRDRYNDMIRAVEQRALARQVEKLTPVQPSWFGVVLVWLGSLMVRWGQALQLRYGTPGEQVVGGGGWVMSDE